MTASCVHFWAVEEPQGPTSTGTCRYCGESREFSNVSNDYITTSDGHSRIPPRTATSDYTMRLYRERQAKLREEQ